MLNLIKSGLVSQESRGELHVRTELVHPLRVLQPVGPNVKDLSCLSPKENLACQNMETSLLLHCRWILYQLSYQGSPSKVYFSTPLPAFILLPSSPQPPLPQEFMVLLHFPMQACSLCSGHILPPPWVPSLHPFLMQTSLPSSQSLPQTHLLKTYLLPVSYSKHSKQQ